MATQLSDSIVSPTARSRFASLMGFQTSDSAKSSRDDDWYIPYNGPIEPPPSEDSAAGRGRSRATSNVTRMSYASSQATRSTFYGGGIGEAPVHNATVARDRSLIHRDRASTFDRMSTYSRDGDWERDKDKDRGGRRGSIASFLTFGQSARKRTLDPEHAFVFPKDHAQQRRPSEESRGQGRRSEDSRWYAPGRPSDESTFSTQFSHLSHNAHTAQSQLQRGRPDPPPAADHEREWEKLKVAPARESMEVSGPAPPGGSASANGVPSPRQPTYGFEEPRRDSPEKDAEEPGAKDLEGPPPREETLATASSQPFLPSAHPYALAFPTVDRDTQPFQHLRPPGHAYSLSQSTTSSQRYVPRPAVSVTVSPAAIAAALNNNTHGLLRSRSATFSAPNLRGLFARDKDTLTRVSSAKASVLKRKHSERRDIPNDGKTQYTAETWCDAILFPRPRFRAHVISPPSSPPDAKHDALLSLHRAVSARNPSRQDNNSATPSLRREHSRITPDRPHKLRKQQSLKSPSKTELVPPSPAYSQQSHSQQAHSQQSHSQHAHSQQAHGEQPPAAAPSPPDETAPTALAEVAQRAREREAWSQVARTSFQNRRSRSLSRTRSYKKSAPPGRPRVDSDVSRSGGDALRARALAVGLAAEAFRQPTPTISVTVSAPGAASGRKSGSNAHSRNASSSNSGGAGHTASRGKVAFKPEESGSSAEEKLEDALMSERTARLSVRGRLEEAAEADVQFVDIGPLGAAPAARDRNARRLEAEPVGGGDRSQSQNSFLSDSLDVPAVGIAISTPPHHSPVEPDIPDLSEHPYAQQSTAPRRRAEPLPVSAPYAGRHPTSFDYTARSPREQLAQHAEGKPPPPAGWEPYAQGPSAYAYAEVETNDSRKSTLGVEEVLLSRTFQRGAGGGHESLERYGVEDPPPLPGPVPRAPTPPPPATPPADAASPASRVRRKPVALNSAYSEIPSLSHTATTATHTTDAPDAAEQVQHVVGEPSTTLSSPTSMGSVSNPTSPRALDDLEPFRDLFYKPGRAGSDARRTPSWELRRALEESTASWSEDRIKSSEGLNGLRNLASRKASLESSLAPQEHDEDEENKQQRAYSPQLDGVQEVQLGPSASPLPGLDNEPVQLGTPLRADYEEGQNFPEDIESSRASSVMDPGEESHEAAEQTLRLGTVQLAVAETTRSERRQSTTLSFGDTEDGESLRPNRDTFATTVSSLGIPAAFEDHIRSSFVTTTSTTSRMSNLIGDFPIPPLGEGTTPPTPVLQSYFLPSVSNEGESRVQSHAPDAADAAAAVPE